MSCANTSCVLPSDNLSLRIAVGVLFVNGRNSLLTDFVVFRGVLLAYSKASSSPALSYLNK